MNHFFMNNLKALPAHSSAGATLFRTQDRRELQGLLGGHGMHEPLMAHSNGNKECNVGEIADIPTDKS